MSHPRPAHPWSALLLSLGLAASIGWACNTDDGHENEADQVGVAAECSVDDDCNHDEDTAGPEFVLECLTNFKGGYCGVVDCTSHDDCPDGSGCVAHDDGSNYCFRLCVDKGECNYHRSADQEANCSANITFVGGDLPDKACVPPEGA